MIGSFFRSKCFFNLDSAVEFIFCFFRLFTILFTFNTFCLCFIILRAKSAMNRQSGKRTSTEGLVGRARIQEPRPVVSHKNTGRALHGGLVRGRERIRTVTLSA